MCKVCRLYGNASFLIRSSESVDRGRSTFDNGYPLANNWSSERVVKVVRGKRMIDGKIFLIHAHNITIHVNDVERYIILLLY